MLRFRIWRPEEHHSSSSEVTPIDHCIAHLPTFDRFGQWLSTLFGVGEPSRCRLAEWCSSAGSRLKRWQGGDRRALVDQYVNTGRPQIEPPSQPVPALRAGAFAVCRCHDDIRMARNDSCGHAGIQISRPGLKARLVLVSNAAKYFKEMVAFHVGFICCRRSRTA